MEDEGYIPRLVDKVIEEDLRIFGAVVIIGTKWCGKTTSSKRFAKSVISLQDKVQYDRYRRIADLNPQVLLRGEKPLLIDEWQTIPEIWDAVRYNIDETKTKGSFILTGSVTIRIDGDAIKHSGIGRIERIRMRTLSLFESGNSTGEVSLSSLFDECRKVSGMSELNLEDVARQLVRGGWPESVAMDDVAAYKIVKSYCNTILESEIDTVDGRRRDKAKMRSILRSLARNSATSASTTTIQKDVSESENHDMSINTLRDYLKALESLCITDNVQAWNPKLRSKTTVRTSETRYLTDPAIAAYFLGAGPDDLMSDPETFGLLFESMAMRDLKVYAQTINGEVFHYRDEDGLEVDAIVHLWDGRWGAIEVKLGDAWADKGAQTLLKLKDRIDESKMKPPAFLMILTASGAAYTRPDGIHVVPLTCLRD